MRIVKLFFVNKSHVTIYFCVFNFSENNEEIWFIDNDYQSYDHYYEQLSLIG